MRSLFFFRFHFQGLKILPMAWNRLLRSAGGCEVVVSELGLASPFLLESGQEIGQKRALVDLQAVVSGNTYFAFTPICSGLGDTSKQ